MAFDDIIQKIRADGEEAVGAVRAQAEAAVARMRAAAEREADALRDSLHRRAQQRAAEHAERLRTMAQLDHRKAVLAEKQRALRDAFAQAEGRLAALGPAEAQQLLGRVIAERLETGREEIVPGREHAHILDDAFVARLNASLRERGRLTRANQPGDFPHGVVLREGRKEINLRLSVLMAEARERLVHRIAEHLFPDGDAPHD